MAPLRSVIGTLVLTPSASWAANTGRSAIGWKGLRLAETIPDTELPRATAYGLLIVEFPSALDEARWPGGGTANQVDLVAGARRRRGLSERPRPRPWWDDLSH
jgi:hypothetical protein